MATTSRSTRRALADSRQAQRRSGRPAAGTATAKHAQIIATEHTTRTQENMHKSARMKRPLDPINSNSDPMKAKRTRITIEIQALPRKEIFIPPKSIALKAPQVSLQRTAVVSTQQKPPPPPLQQPALPPIAAVQPSAPGKTDSTNTSEYLTSHQKKVINGIKHELDRLQPNAAVAGQAKDEKQGRKLRSQEATRFKSELSAYFPDYDEVIGNDEKEQHILILDTPILVVDSKPPSPPHSIRTLPPRQAAAAAASHLQQQTSANSDLSHHHNFSSSYSAIPDDYSVRSYGDALFTGLHDSQRIDLPFLGARRNGDEVEDPLPDSHYEPAHKKAERLEKSIRNTEKGRAQHEKDQIIRLLGELQGPDWLRTMGVSGVTESRKKTFEPARDHFIKGCQAILEKFRSWSEEEKKRKRERERALAEEAGSTAEKEQENEVEEEEIQDSEGAISEDEAMVDAGPADDMPDYLSDGDPPLSDVDASIAKQLHEEAALAKARFAPPVSSKRPRGEVRPAPEPYVPKEFTSFFEKKYERDAALTKLRRSRRAVMAWGHHVPEAEDVDFSLSEEYRDDETMRTRERRKRRDRRGSRH